MSARSALAGSAFSIAAGAVPAVCFLRYLDAWEQTIRAAAGKAVLAAGSPTAGTLASIAHSTFLDARFWALAAATWLGATCAAAAVSLCCGSLGFAPGALVPKASRLFGSGGLARLASVENFVQAACALVAVSVIAALALPLLSRELSTLAQADEFPQQAMVAAHACTLLWLYSALPLAIVAAFDIAVQRRRHSARLRMTTRELRDERAETESRPEAKQRRRAIGAKRARGLRIAAIARATAIITNPTHVAIALRYAPPELDVPTVVARGADLMATVVRAAARSFGVPVIESPELARTLYAQTDVDEPIPVECYAAVAAIFAWIMRTRGALRRGDEEAT